MNTTFKFGLTLAATLVLAACGSSGGNKSNNTAAQTPAAQTPAAQTPAAQTPANAITAGDSALLVEDKSVEYGGKFAKKVKSDFIVPGTNGESDSSGAAAAMTVRLDPSLDTVVIASKTDRNGNLVPGSELIYLEDFDFRKPYATATDIRNSTSTGRTTLEHIHNAGAIAAQGDAYTYELNTGAGHPNTKSTPRANPEGTKTAEQGTSAGDVLVYKDTRAIIADTSNPDNKYENSMYIDRAEKAATANVAHVAEVYGHRTFVAGDSVIGRDDSIVGTNTKGELAVANTPLINKRLMNVQYGRVTSSLNGLTEENLRAGKVQQGDIKTRIASFANYKAEGSESSYFYRGVNPTAEATKKNGAALVAALKERYTDGKINYAGHAVTYGFTHKYDQGARTGGVPNAITGSAAEPRAVSGTHVFASVDLENYNVTGRLYDKYDVDGAIKDQNIATFSGTLTNYGNVLGSSKRSDGAEGTFRATLFGSTAQELGGSISSTDTTEANSWGAVFGAQQSDALTGLGIGTDSNARTR